MFPFRLLYYKSWHIHLCCWFKEWLFSIHNISLNSIFCFRYDKSQVTHILVSTNSTLYKQENQASWFPAFHLKYEQYKNFWYTRVSSSSKRLWIHNISDHTLQILQVAHIKCNISSVKFSLKSSCHPFSFPSFHLPVFCAPTLCDSKQMIP